MKDEKRHVSTFELVREDVSEELKKNSLLAEDNVLVDVEGEEIILYGDVDTEEKKKLVNDIVLSVPGVLHITNNLKVIDVHKFL
jgi:osmotically-inducible protein OsmY